MTSKAPDLLASRMPEAVEAEAAVLGAILLDGRLIWQARELIRADWFYYDAYAVVFRAMCRLADEGRSLDHITLEQEIRRTDDLERVGGMSGVVDLVDGRARLENLDHHARLIREAALLRAMIRYGDLTAAEALAAEHPPAEVLERAQGRLSRIAGAAVSDVDDTAAGVSRAFHADFENPDARRGLATGFPTLDHLTSGGLRAGELWYLAAYTSTGKTAFASSVAIALASAGYHVDFLTYEMPPSRLFARLLSTGWEIDLQHLRLGRLTADELERYTDARAFFETAPLRIVNAAGLTVSDLRSRAHRLRAEGQLDVMITDYIGRIPVPGRQSRAVEVGAVSSALAEIATTLEVSNLVLVQINREGAKSNEEPELWWLRDSGGQENDADLVAFLIREKDRAEGVLYVKKQRDGPLGAIPMYFDKRFARYSEAGRYS